MDVVRPAQGRPRADAEDQRGRKQREAERRAKDAARQKQKRDRERDLAKAAGTYRPRGRPKNSAPDPSRPGAV
jgi:hypothetical protein